MNAKHLEILMQALREHREASLPKKPHLDDKGQNMFWHQSYIQKHAPRDQGPATHELPNEPAAHSPFAKQSLPPFVKPTTPYPTKAGLHLLTKFGKSNRGKAFVVPGMQN
jgi:hypothetical protein